MGCGEGDLARDEEARKNGWGKYRDVPPAERLIYLEGKVKGSIVQKQTIDEITGTVSVTYTDNEHPTKYPMQITFDAINRFCIMCPHIEELVIFATTPKECKDRFMSAIAEYCITYTEDCREELKQFKESYRCRS